MAASAESLRPTAAGMLARLWRSSVGKKYVVAVTGLGLWLFVLVHLAGNLQVFLPAHIINSYAYNLKANPLILWGARLSLLGMAALHVTATIQLALANRRARPARYAVGKPVASSLAQRTMVVSGLVLLAFILFHLAHFTIGLVDPELLALRDPATGHHDVHRMMVTGFSNCLVSGFYIAAMGLLMFHLSHGISSIFQSLGLRSRKTYRFLRNLAHAVAILIFIGNCSIPLAILAGWVK
jgi:succinate dehydrogenase / fumarate reductase, cytochrome b subunit